MKNIIKNKVQKAKSMYQNVKLSTNDAALIFAASLIGIIMKLKFPPKTEHKAAPIAQAMKYIDYAAMAVSSAVLLARGALALKKKFQDKGNDKNEGKSEDKSNTSYIKSHFLLQ